MRYQIIPFCRNILTVLVNGKIVLEFQLSLNVTVTMMFFRID